MRGNQDTTYVQCTTMEAFVQGTESIEKEQEKLVIHGESKLILERVDANHTTKTVWTFWPERTTYEKEQFLKPTGVVHREEI